MEILTTILLIFASLTFSIFLIYEGVTGLKKTLKVDKKQ
jgi:hypothetical protein